MRIVSLNAWGGALHAALIPWVAAIAPDILCLQEVIRTPDSRAGWLTYRDGAHVLPQRANLYGELAAALPDHAGIFCPAARGPLWDGDRAVPSFWGLATFLRRDLALVGQVQGFVHGAYGHDGFGDHPRPRNAHGLRVFDPALGFVSVVQMHGLRDPSGKGDTPARAAQARRLLDLAAQLAQPGDIRVICGDLNVEPGSATLAALGDAGLTELVTAGGHPGTRTAHYPRPGRFADYMATDRPDAVRGFAVVRDPEVSDHCPLVLDL